MIESGNEMAQRNKKYQHFALFKQSIEHFPGRTLDIIVNHASSDFKNSPYIQQCLTLHTMSIFSSFNKLFFGSTAAVLAATFVLHRQRAWVLTAPGGLRSIFFKYFPVWIGYGFYEFNYSVKVPVDKVNEDFGEINDQFWNLYSTHGDFLKSGLATLGK